MIIRLNTRIDADNCSRWNQIWMQKRTLNVCNNDSGANSTHSTLCVSETRKFTNWSGAWMGTNLHSIDSLLTEGSQKKKLLHSALVRFSCHCSRTPASEQILVKLDATIDENRKNYRTHAHYIRYPWHRRAKWSRRPFFQRTLHCVCFVFHSWEAPKTKTCMQ